jgi:acetyl-CoA C-acetyltransferase
VSADSRTPVLVGVAATHRRCEDARDALESVELMIEAVERAAEDAGSKELLSRAGSVGVPRGFWDYSDPGRLIADRIAAKQARTALAEIGVLQQTLIGRACTSIASGDERVAIVTGGDAKYRTLRAQIAGIEVSDTQQSGVAPDTRLEPAGSLWDDMEPERGLVMPVQYFAVMENALRYSQGLDVERHRDEVAQLYARFSSIAGENPDAWGPTGQSPAEIRDASPKNKMLSFPYTKLHNSSWNVDQAGALIFCSVAVARELGIPESRWVYPLASTESNHMQHFSTRPELHRSVGAAIAGRRALALSGKGAAQIDHVELYSCFPAAVRIFALELDLPQGRDLTVTGGMSFAGGPLNNFVIQSTVRMAQVLRDDPGTSGLVSSLSGFNTKQAFGVYSTEPGADGFHAEDCTPEVEAASELRPLVRDYEGPATVVGYTVVYLGEATAKGIAVCDLPDGRRTVANTEDPAVMAAMLDGEFCGREVGIGAEGALRDSS